jgi:GxxExxY protein
MTRDPQTYSIIGAAMEVHKELGCGFLEAVYQEALAEEFKKQGILFRREVDFPVYYKDKQLVVAYRADFLCFNEIVVEIKALQNLSGIERAQLINYLKASEIERGLLVNFGASSLQYERFILNHSEKSVQSVKSADNIL